MIGFSVYSYEGIGIILPILDLTEKPQHYPKILLAVLTTVMVSYIGFGEFCLFTYGTALKEPIITSNLPRGSVFIYLIKIGFCFNLFITYPLVIYPANMIIETYVYAGMVKSKKRQWLKNLTRAIMVIFTIVFSLLMGPMLDQFLSLLGGLACTPIAFTLPTLFHYKLCAVTRKQKIIDISIIVLSLCIMVFCTGFCLFKWHREEPPPE